MSQSSESISSASLDLIKNIRQSLSETIVGQAHLIDSLLIGLITDGHLLLEGLPGLAKTLSIKTLASLLNADFKRIQFTPDLLPSDLTGTMLYDFEAKTFSAKKGPVFTHFLLADEINRAPAKVQSALLEAMGERQVTLGDQTYALPTPFLVLATQNPIEQEGTFPLPEAQTDRFLFKVTLTYPSISDEKQILEKMGDQKLGLPKSKFSLEAISHLKTDFSKVFSDDRIKDYLLHLVAATRQDRHLSEKHANLNRLKEIQKYLRFGVSPRGSLFWYQAAKAHALLEGRTFVLPDDVKSVAFDILRHRLGLTFEAEVEQVRSDELIESLLDSVFVP